MDRLIENAYRLARERYAQMEVDVERAVRRLHTLAISIHCWQGDDVAGFEDRVEAIGGGLAVTGAYPGRARTPDELRSDLDKALALIPGTHRVNLHASYAETGNRRTERNELQPEHFQNWVEWARERQLGLDFNPTFFAHPRADDGLTLTHPDDAIRRFWIEHGQVCRRIGAWMGAALGQACVTNVWIPDGMKDLPVDRLGPRRRLEAALDEVFQEPFDASVLRDAVECKLFGLGSESYVAGSHEFYLGYAITRQKVLCLDTGHFHPTEMVSDKLSAVALYVPELLLHVSRGVRWDSDHVVIMSDELLALAHELVRGELLERVHLGLDYFDASINRVAAWVIGTRCLLRALLIALLEPVERLREYEAKWDFTSRLALTEELKSLPHGAVWDYYCLQQGVPVGLDWLDEVKRYERQMLAR